MKKIKKTKKPTRLTLAKESIRKLAAPELANVQGGGTTHNGHTVTFPKCCRTA